MLTAKINMLNVLPMCQDKFEIIYDLEGSCGPE